jgi:hypothetical protein
MLKTPLQPPLIFVYLGSKFPDFAYQSVNFSKINSNLDILLLTNAKYKVQKFKIPQSNIINLDFYSPPNNIDMHMPHLKKFRKAFWTKTLERFFILEQYCSNNNIQEFFHAELDNITFELERLHKFISEKGFKGLFLPRQSNDTMVASLLYCNNLNTLKYFNTFSLNEENLDYNEMKLLSLFQYKNDSVFTLPSTTSDHILNFDFDLTSKEIDGIVDGNLYGRYFFGKDRRNVNGSVFNMFKHSRGGDINWSDQKYESTNLNGKYQVYLIEEDTYFKFYNLHIHSKLIEKNVLRIDKILNNLNKGKKTLIALNPIGYLRIIYNYTLLKLKNFIILSISPKNK